MNKKARALVAFTMSAVWVVSVASVAMAQAGGPAATTSNPESASISAPASSGMPVSTLKIPEGTAIHVRLGEALSSSTASVGDTFAVVLDDAISLPDGQVIAAGYSGQGEVTIAEKSGLMGKSGKLGLKLNYLKVGDSRVRLRSNKVGEGKSGLTNAVVGVVFLGIGGLLIHGHNIVYPKGQALLAYADEDKQLPLPLAAPPVMN